jgi:hypothetical protein
MVDVIAPIGRAGIVTNPLVVAVDMGGIRVSGSIAIVTARIILRSRATVLVMRGV